MNICRSINLNPLSNCRQILENSKGKVLIQETRVDSIKSSLTLIQMSSTYFVKHKIIVKNSKIFK